MKKNYSVTRDFWDGPILRVVGESLVLTADQAKYLGNRIEEAQPDRRARAKRGPKRKVCVLVPSDRRARAKRAIASDITPPPSGSETQE